MATVEQDFTITEGAEFAFIIRVKQADGVTPFDLSNFTGRGQVRKKQDTDSALLLNLNLALSTPAAGDITVSLPADQVPPDGTLGFKEGGFFDVEIENTGDPGEVKRLVQGQIFPNANVTLP